MPNKNCPESALLEQMRQLVNQESDRYLSRDLTGTVKRALTQITLRYLGIDNKWNRLELTTEGASRLQQHLQAETTQRCDRYWDRILQEALTRLERDDQLQQRLVQQLLDKLEEQIAQAMRSRVKELGQELAEKILQQLQPGLSDRPQPDLLGSADPADPGSFSGPLGKRLLRKLARQLAQGDD